MSQVGIARPMTQQSMSGRLPQIEHPMSRLSKPGNLDIRGTSRGGVADSPYSVVPASGRPLGREASNTPARRSIHSSGGRISRVNNKPQGPPPTNYDAIPEGVEVSQGDPNKTKIPIFGNRADMASRSDTFSRPGNNSRVSSRLSKSSAQTRLEIDELETILREKVKTGYYEVRKRFKDNDPEQKGNVTRDAFFRIMVTTLNRPLNQGQFSRLATRLGFKDKDVIGFTEFFAHFRETPSAEYPRWMDPVQRNCQDRANMSADQVHALLQEKAKQRVRDIADLIPQSNPDGSGHILKSEFRNVLNRMGFYQEDTDFEKLWAKYDREGSGTINGEKMMKRLGISIDRSSVLGGRNSPQDEIRQSRDSVCGLKRKEAERQRSLDIERWLKHKLREGFNNMKAAFIRMDKDNTGTVGHDEFLEVLAQYGLNLEKPHLAEFLARCSIEPTRTGVGYRDFLHKFQDRSESGMPHKILTDSKHRYNRPDSPGCKSTMSSLEVQIMNMFQRDFLTLLGTFHKIDRLGMDAISQEEFRAAIESRFDMEITDEQFRLLIDRVPLDEDGNVQYAEFMGQFDTKGKAKSLFGESLRKSTYKPIGPLPEDKEPPMGTGKPEEMEVETDQSGQADRLVVTQENDDVMTEVRSRRGPQELFKIIKELIKKNFQSVEEQFADIDELNTRRITQETMYQLLKRFDIDPDVTRGEIRDLWKTFITNQDKTLDWNQFVRHFGYSLKSATYPNAKISPPKQGDSDFHIRSRKLNCAADMLQDTLRAKIDYTWEDLRREFIAMDPYATGCVSTDEFYEILSELCIHLSDYELEMLTKKFSLKDDGRVSYIEFLKPFAMRKQIWRYGNNMLTILQHPRAELPVSDIVEHPQKGLCGITAKLRQKISGDWKNLRRAFKKLDVSNQGYLSLPEFRSVLKLANVILDEDDIYHLMSQFDESMSGRISYNKFLSETFKPATAQSHMRKSTAF